MTIKPFAIDISHHNTVRDFGMAKASGIVGVIHKVTQGKAYADPDYAGRRVQALASGLLWGAYHFNSGDNIKSQVAWFLAKAKPDDKTLLVLDYEDNRLSQMNIEQAVEFLHEVEAQVGRKAAIYSGNRIKETIGDLSQSERDYLTSHRLWLAQYGAVAHLPTGFKNWWLWQFTGDGVGPLPHNIPGIVAGNGGIDINTYGGTAAQLASEWT
jgi:lysozyme